MKHHAIERWVGPSQNLVGAEEAQSNRCGEFQMEYQHWSQLKLVIQLRDSRVIQSFRTSLVAGSVPVGGDQPEDRGEWRGAALAHARYIGRELGAGEADLYQACLSIEQRKN